MILQNQITEKVNSLKSYSIAQNATIEVLFVPLETAINNYFNTGNNISKSLSDVVKYMYNDIRRFVIDVLLSLLNYQMEDTSVPILNVITSKGLGKL